jgi:hypothetical protein
MSAKTRVQCRYRKKISESELFYFLAAVHLTLKKRVKSVRYSTPRAREIQSPLRTTRGALERSLGGIFNAEVKLILLEQVLAQEGFLCRSKHNSLAPSV